MIAAGLRTLREEGAAAFAGRASARLGLLASAGRAAVARAVHAPGLGPRGFARSQCRPLDPRVAGIPGMTTRYERRFLSWYAAEMFSGRGLMVDLGAWLGASSAALGAGLEHNRTVASPAALVRSYDLFLWEEGMAANLHAVTLTRDYREGESFLPDFLRWVAPWSRSIVACPGDLQSVPPPAEPIELLFVDAMKTWDVANAILAGYFPRLIPGVSLVVHQDFAHFYTGWIALVMYRLRDVLRPVYHVPLSCSVAFRCEAEVPPAALGPYRLSDFPEPEQDAAFAWAMQLVPGYMRSALLAARAMLYVHDGQLDRAERELRTLERNAVPMTWDVRKVHDYLRAARATA